MAPPCQRKAGSPPPPRAAAPLLKAAPPLRRAAPRKAPARPPLRAALRRAPARPPPPSKPALLPGYSDRKTGRAVCFAGRALLLSPGGEALENGPFTGKIPSCIMKINRGKRRIFWPGRRAEGEREHGSFYKGPVLLPVTGHLGGAHLAAKPGDLRGELCRQCDDRLFGGRRHLWGVHWRAAPVGAADVRGRHRGRHPHFGRPVLGQKRHPEHP